MGTVAAVEVGEAGGLLRESHPMSCARHVGACPLITCASSCRRSNLTDAAANEASDAHQHPCSIAGESVHMQPVCVRVYLQNRFVSSNFSSPEYANFSNFANISGAKMTSAEKKI